MQVSKGLQIKSNQVWKQSGPANQKSSYGAENQDLNKSYN